VVDNRSGGKHTNTIVMGVDPGSRQTGFGVISICGRTLNCISFGCIKLPVTKPVTERLNELYEEMNQLISQYNVDELAVENLFTGKNPQSILKLGQVRGVILLAGIRRGLKIGEYPPATVKQAVVGYGRATKEQIQFMVQKTLNLTHLPTPLDASDALALAICHSSMNRFKPKQGIRK
jgi:crossover junction endodeoxyribonuclease RuvC